MLGKADQRIAVGVQLAFARRAVMDLVVGQGVAIGPNHVGVNQSRPLSGAGVLRGLREDVEGGEHIAAIHFLNEETGKSGQQLGYGPAGGVDLHRHRDGVAVVLHQEDHRQLQVGRGVERLPELSLTGGPVARGAENHLVALGQLIPVWDAIDLRVPQPGFGASDSLEELGSGGARGADDVEVFVPPMGRHLPATGVRVIGRADGGEELLGGGHAQAQAQRPVPIVGIEPVVGGTEHPGRGGEDGLVARPRNLEEDLVLALELDLLVVYPACEKHDAV